MKTKIFQVVFKRNQKSKTERGIAIGDEFEEIKIIIDKNFKKVKAPVWNFTSLPSEGCLPIEL